MKRGGYGGWLCIFYSCLQPRPQMRRVLALILLAAALGLPQSKFNKKIDYDKLEKVHARARA